MKADWDLFLVLDVLRRCHIAYLLERPQEIGIVGEARKFGNVLETHGRVVVEQLLRFLYFDAQ